MPIPYRLVALSLGALLLGCNATTPVLEEAPQAATPVEPEPLAPQGVPLVTAFDPASISMEQVKMPPGEFIWEPEKASGGALEIRIVMPRQTAYVYRGDSLIGIAGISTGKPGYETPAGSYTILQKKRDHVSNIYPDGEMPFMQRLTWGGVALHGGLNPGYPASHGCIRFPHEFAEILFGATRIGTRVVVLDEDPAGVVAGEPTPVPAAGNAVMQNVLAEQ